MNRIQFRDFIFYVLWIWSALAVVLACATSGTSQLIGEGYLTILATLNTLFIIVTLSSNKFQESIAMNVDRRRTPHSIEWAGIVITLIAGYTLMNWLIMAGAIVGAVTKLSMDKIHERLRSASLPLRAIRDGVVHKDEVE